MLSQLPAGGRRFFVRWLALSVLGVGLAGCSSFSLLYTFVDSYLIDQADTYLAPNDEEAAFIERKIDALMAWHTAEMLPRYARTLESWADRFEAGPLERADTAGVVKELRETIDAVIIAGAPVAAEILVRHTAPEQIQHLKERLAEKLADRREEIQAPADERAAERIEDIADNLERFTGTLNDDQRAIIERYVAGSAGSGVRWLENRAKRQAAFADYLAQRPGKQQLGEFLIRILLRPHEIVDPGYREISEGRWLAMEVLMFDVLSTLNAAQRRETLKNLREYAADMREAAAD